MVTCWRVNMLNVPFIYSSIYQQWLKWRKSIDYKIWIDICCCWTDLQTVDLQLADVLLGGQAWRDPDQLACRPKTNNCMRDGVLQRSRHVMYQPLICGCRKHVDNRWHGGRLVKWTWEEGASAVHSPAAEVWAASSCSAPLMYWLSS